MRRAVDAALGVVVLVLVGVLVAVVVLVYQQTFVKKVQVQLKTGSIGNALRVGSDVEVRGVPVGRVEKITTSGDGATLTLAIDPADAPKIPADSTARLLPKTLFGERFVSLQTPTGSGSTSSVAYLRDGDVLHEDTSAQSVELQDVFDDLLPLLQAVQPEKLSAMLSELASTLRGKGQDLGDTATIAATYLGQLNPMVPQLTDDLAALGRVATNYAGAAPDLLAAFDNLSTSTKTLVADRRALAATFARVTSSSNAGTGFLSANEQTIAVISKQSRRALKVVKPYAKVFPCVFASLRGFIPRMDTALRSGTGQPGLQADVTIAAVNGAGAAVAGKESGSQPSCPVHNPDGSVGSASSTATGGDGQADAQALGLGQANSPQENQVLAELLAPGLGIEPSQFPDWGSLLLGPILRGSAVELR